MRSCRQQLLSDGEPSNKQTEKRNNSNGYRQQKTTNNSMQCSTNRASPNSAKPHSEFARKSNGAIGTRHIPKENGTVNGTVKANQHARKTPYIQPPIVKPTKEESPGELLQKEGPKDSDGAKTPANDTQEKSQDKCTNSKEFTQQTTTTTDAAKSQPSCRITIQTFSYKQALLKGMPQTSPQPLQPALPPKQDNSSVAPQTTKMSKSQTVSTELTQPERPSSGRKSSRQATNLTIKHGGSVPQRQRGKSRPMKEGNNKDVAAIDSATPKCNEGIDVCKSENDSLSNVVSITKDTNNSSNSEQGNDSASNVVSLTNDTNNRGKDSSQAKDLPHSEAKEHSANIQTPEQEKTLTRKTALKTQASVSFSSLPLDSIKAMLAKINSEIACVKTKRCLEATDLSGQVTPSSKGFSEMDTPEIGTKRINSVPVVKEDKTTSATAAPVKDIQKTQEKTKRPSSISKLEVTPVQAEAAIYEHQHDVTAKLNVESNPKDSAAIQQRSQENEENKVVVDRALLRKKLETYPDNYLDYTDTIDNVANIKGVGLKPTNRFHPRNIRKTATSAQLTTVGPKYSLLKPITAKPKEEDVFETLICMQAEESKDTITQSTKPPSNCSNTVVDNEDNDLSMPVFSSLNDKPNDYYISFPDSEEENGRTDGATSLDESIQDGENGNSCSVSSNDLPQNGEEIRKRVSAGATSQQKILTPDTLVQHSVGKQNTSYSTNLDMFNLEETDSLLNDFQLKMAQLRKEMSTLRETKVLRKVIDMDDLCTSRKYVGHENASLAPEKSADSLDCSACRSPVTNKAESYQDVTGDYSDCRSPVKNKAVTHNAYENRMQTQEAKHVAKTDNDDILDDDYTSPNGITHHAYEHRMQTHEAKHVAKKDNTDSLDDDYISPKSSVDFESSSNASGVGGLNNEVESLNTELCPSPDEVKLKAWTLRGKGSGNNVNKAASTPTEETDNNSSGSVDNHDTGFDCTSSDFDDEEEITHSLTPAQAKRAKFLDHMENKMELYFSLQDHLEDMQDKMRQLQQEMVKANKLLIGMMENTLDDLSTSNK